MTLSELKKKLVIERQVLTLLGDLPFDIFKPSRITFQLTRIGELDNLLKQIENGEIKLPLTRSVATAAGLPEVEQDHVSASGENPVS